MDDNNKKIQLQFLRSRVKSATADKEALRRKQRKLRNSTCR